MNDLLANPIWNSLSTQHLHLALGDERARIYREEIGPLSGMPEPSKENWAALSALIAPGKYAVLFLNEPPRAPEDLKVVMEFPIDQMLSDPVEGWKADGAGMEPLTEADVPEMLALTALTEPGPFRQKTIDLGGYWGIRQRGQLAAMAGQRTAVPGYREVSAVCTHPDFRGRGYAAVLIQAVGAGIVAQGERPYLHVKQDNAGAIALYRKLGFEHTRTFYGVVVAKPTE